MPTGGSPGYYRCVPGVLQGLYRVVSGVSGLIWALYECYRCVTGRFKGVPQECYISATGVLEEYHRCIKGVLQGFCSRMFPNYV